MDKTDIDKRINRLIGQIEGIRRMIHQQREASAILQQILAGREALSKIGMLVMKQALSSIRTKNVDRLVKEVFRV